MSASTTSTDPLNHISIVIVGHVDAGKSTTTGHLLFELGSMSDRTKAKLQEEADRMGKSSFAFAFFMDTGKEERERGVTINCQTQKFTTDNFEYTITDAPGHRDFVKNMITGAGQADVALLMVPADGKFEASIAKPDAKADPPIMEGQTRQHARLINLLGIKQVMVGINKMDAKGVDYSEDRFNEIKDEVTRMLKASGYNPATIPFIPMSGFQGDNLIKPSDKMPWYKGWSAKISKDQEVKGITLLDALNNYVQRPTRDMDGAVRMPLGGDAKIPGIGTILTGRVETGTVRKNDTVKFADSGVEGKVFSIQMHHEDVDAGFAGFNIGMNVKFPKGIKMPKRGDMMFVVDDPKDTPETTPRRVKSFRAMVRVENHPGELKVGFCPVVCVRTGRDACRIKEIHYKQNKKEGKVENPPFVKSGDMAEVTFEPTRFLYIEPFERCEGLGRVAILEGNSLVMLGRVKDVEYV
jgi:elongation factor 1-alpha